MGLNFENLYGSNTFGYTGEMETRYERYQGSCVICKIYNLGGYQTVKRAEGDNEGSRDEVDEAGVVE
jgi:hypothetical protein